MIPHKLTLCLLLIIFPQIIVLAQKRKPPSGGRLAIVVDERLAALRATPELNGRLVRRLGRGRLVAVRSMKTSSDGIVFFLVNVTSRTHGWIQREAVASTSRAGDDQRLLRLLKASSGFDRIARARIFLDHFPRSPLRPEVLLLLGDTAEEVATKLSTDAARRIRLRQINQALSLRRRRLARSDPPLSAFVRSCRSEKTVRGTLLPTADDVVFAA